MNYKNYFYLMLGSIIEWYDLSLCGIFTSELAGNFFPQKGHDIILLFYTVYGISYIIRPIGALIFGYLGDVFGYGVSLNISIFVAGLCSLCLGALPGYTTIGTFAIIIFIVLRLIQNLCVSAQLGGIISYASHHSKNIRKHHSGLYAGLAFSSSVGGVIVALLVSILSTYVFGDKSDLVWRVPFLASIIPLVIYFIIINKKFSVRYDSFKKIDFINSAKNLFSYYYKLIIILSIISIVSGVLYNIFFVYIMDYMSNRIHLDKMSIYFINLATLTLSVIMYPALGFISDRINKQKHFAQISLVFLAISVVGLFTTTANLYLFLGFLCLVVIFYCGFMGSALGILSNSFAYSNQMCGASLVLAISSIFSGLSLSVTHLIDEHTIYKNLLMYFVIAFCILGLIMLQFVKNYNVSGES